MNLPFGMGLFGLLVSAVFAFNAWRELRRNVEGHARNAAIRASRGRYLWVIDSDFIWEPNAVAHAIAIMDAAAKGGKVIALSPVLIAINEDPNIWVAQTASWVEGLETHDTMAMIKKVRTGGEVYSGFADQRRAEGLALIDGQDRKSVV